MVVDVVLVVVFVDEDMFVVDVGELLVIEIVGSVVVFIVG